MAEYLTWASENNHFSIYRRFISNSNLNGLQVVPDLEQEDDEKSEKVLTSVSPVKASPELSEFELRLNEASGYHRPAQHRQKAIETRQRLSQPPCGGGMLLPEFSYTLGDTFANADPPLNSPVLLNTPTNSSDLNSTVDSWYISFSTFIQFSSHNFVP